MRRRQFLGDGAKLAGAFVCSLVGIRSRPKVANRVHVASGHKAFSSSYTVPAGSTFRFDPTVDTTIETDSNFIVNGVLDMRPNPGVTHTLRFVNVNEAAFQGGTMTPVASDVGLWVMDTGRLLVEGTPKKGWNRTGDDPTWDDADELRVAPIATGDWGANGFAAFTRGHTPPRARADVPRAEVMNLSRNVRIEGTPGGRSHIFIKNNTPTVHSLRHAAVRYMGPRKNNGVVLGRWGVHFHMGADYARGSTVEGVVVRNCGSHAFVPHATNGITFRDCVAYDNQTTAYWWDKKVAADASFDVLYDSCIAAKVHPGDAVEPGNYHGFITPAGTGNRLQNCAAVGVSGTPMGLSSGFNWPEATPGLSTWTSDGCVTHNNMRNGVYDWLNQQNPVPSQTTNLTAYRNGAGGIDAGAYGFSQDFTDVLVVDHPNMGGFAVDAVASWQYPSDGNAFHNLTLRDCKRGLTVNPHGTSDQRHPERVYDTVIENCAIPVEMTLGGAAPGALPKSYDFVRITVDGNDVTPGDITIVAAGAPGSVLRVQRRNGTAWKMNLNTGAVTDPIPPFA